jgi:DNA repair protein RadC
MKQVNTLHEIHVKYTRSYGTEAIKDSETAYSICKQAYAQAEANINLKEYFIVILLNRANQVIGYYKLSEGGLSGTVADVRLAFSVALKCLASAMIITHCHPSGQLKPSSQDLKLTKQFVEAGKLMEIQVLDHLIVSIDGYFSFANEGLI